MLQVDKIILPGSQHTSKFSREKYSFLSYRIRNRIRNSDQMLYCICITITLTSKYWIIYGFLNLPPYFPEDAYRYSFMLPSTWHECWSSAHAGQSIHDKPWAICTSYMQNFHSLNDRLNVLVVIVGACKLYKNKSY